MSSEVITQEVDQALNLRSREIAEKLLSGVGPSRLALDYGISTYAIYKAMYRAGMKDKVPPSFRVEFDRSQQLSSIPPNIESLASVFSGGMVKPRKVEKRPRLLTQYTLEEKIRALIEIEKGEDYRVVADKLGIIRSTLYTWTRMPSLRTLATQSMAQASDASTQAPAYKPLKIGESAAVAHNIIDMLDSGEDVPEFYKMLRYMFEHVKTLEAKVKELNQLLAQKDQLLEQNDHKRDELHNSVKAALRSLAE